MERIKKQYEQVLHKASFIDVAAVHFDKSPGTLKNHWFSTRWAIPKSYQKDVLKLLKRWVNHQNKLRKF